MCLGIFGIGGGLLFLTNLLRFGNGFEFGHQLNLQYLYGSLYATRFDHPFENEPLVSAARELFTLLFLEDNFNGGAFYRGGFFLGQSLTIRWREIYLSAYDVSFFGCVLFGWAVSIWHGWRLPPGAELTAKASISTDLELERVLTVVGLYSLISAFLLVWFFMRSPVIASRYLLDFMPSFSAAMLVAWLGWCHLCRKRRSGVWILAVLVAALVAWIVWELATSSSAYGPPQPRTWQEVSLQSSVPGSVSLPVSGCYNDATKPESTGIPYNGTGWQAPAGEVMPCVILFVQDPEFLELQFATQDLEANSAGPQHVRAKVGLEFLERQQVQFRTNGWVIRFAGPQHPRYQKGIQTVFLATVPKAQLAERKTPWRLVHVRWRTAAQDEQK
jgi:hypothetical protein